MTTSAVRGESRCTVLTDQHLERLRSEVAGRAPDIVDEAVEEQQLDAQRVLEYEPKLSPSR